MSGTATFIRNVTEMGPHKALFRVEPPFACCVWDLEANDFKDTYTEFVIVSGAYVPFTGPETYIFSANEDGEVISWGELDGSFRGDIDIERALRGAGYEIAP